MRVIGFAGLMHSSLILGIAATAACEASLVGSEGACDTTVAFSVNSTVSGTIDDEDCARDGTVGDYYTFTVASQSSMRLTLAVSGFEGGLGLYAGTPSGQSIEVFEVEGSGTIGANVFLPPGPYYIAAGTQSGSGGSYTLVSQPVQETGCGQFLWYTRPGVTINGTVTGNDCVGLGPTRFDGYQVWLEPGETLSASAVIDKPGGLSLRAGAANTPDLDSHILSGAGTSEVSYTAPRADFYRVHVNGAPSMSGNTTYSVTIQ